MTWRREKILVGLSLAAFAGVAVVFGSMLWLLWHDWMATETALVGGLARQMGDRTQHMMQDTRDLLARLDQLQEAPCSPGHLERLEEAAASRPYLRALGYWRAADRLCGVGFLQTRALRPPRADRIYDNGVIAWWPSPSTEVGGVQLFLMRYGNHDAAIDPRELVDIGPLANREVALWVEGLRMASEPAGADVPIPTSLAVGVNVDHDAGQVVSRFSHDAPFPIDVVAVEPMSSFWGRHARMLAAASLLGLVMAAAWLTVVLTYSRRRLGLAGELREALTHRCIWVEYQPIVALTTGRPVGAEALARWTRANGEVVPPEVFIPIAEREGLVSAVTLAVLDRILPDLGTLLPLSPDFSVNLNLSADDLASTDFALTLAARLEAAAVPARSIKLEITERALVQSGPARLLIETLRERGHDVAIDDFGTGYSSLSYLERFPLDVLKIDRTFVAAIGSGPANTHVIEHIVEMAQSLGLRTVAEGVESDAQRRWLVEHGVEYAQGYLFSPPVSVNDLRDRLTRRRAA